jgi:hypothetical protein
VFFAGPDDVRHLPGGAAGQGDPLHADLSTLLPAGDAVLALVGFMALFPPRTGLVNGCSGAPARRPTSWRPNQLVGRLIMASWRHVGALWCSTSPA